MHLAAGSIHTPAPPEPQKATGLDRWVGSRARETRLGGLHGARPDGSDWATCSEDAYGELVALSDVTACVAAVLGRYPDMLLQDARASWLRDQIARQILEEVAALHRVTPRGPAVTTQAPWALATSEMHRCLDRVEPPTEESTVGLATAAASASVGGPDASPPMHSPAPAPNENSSFGVVERPMPGDTSASERAAASGQEPAPPRATPHAVSTADAISMRWQALFPRERTAGGDRFEVAAAVGIPRARVYRRSCPAVASSDSGISHPADAA